MTIDLLCNYGFILHSNLKHLTEEEILNARELAKDYLSKHSDYVSYAQDFKTFVNRIIFEKITGQDYEEIKSHVQEVLQKINQLVKDDSQKYNIYCNLDLDDTLIFIGEEDEFCTCSHTILKYDLLSKNFSLCEKNITSDYSLLGSISIKNLDYNSIENISI